MDKRKKYFRVVAVFLLMIGILGYKGIANREFRIQAAKMIAGEGMIRLVEAQYMEERSGWETGSYGETKQSAGSIRGIQKKYGDKAVDIGSIQKKQGQKAEESVTDRSDNTDLPRAALTFDDGPHAKYTP